jgi:predicted RNA polymerase sigma factor
MHPTSPSVASNPPGPRAMNSSLPGDPGAQVLASAWPVELLDTFCRRMASHGMCVSRTLMQNDRRYGLDQLAQAHTMADDALRLMAVQLFRCFEARQSGISSRH